MSGDHNMNQKRRGLPSSQCPHCERHRLSAAMWRNKAYEASGTPLPWEPEELLRKEYERGYADAMGWKLQNHLEHLPPTEPK